MKNIKTIIILLLVTIMTACQQTPSTTIINNVQNEMYTDETVESVDMDDLPIILMNEEKINEELQCGEVKVTLNGIVSKPDSYESLYSYTPKIVNYNKYESNMMFLFGGYVDEVYRDELTKHLRAYVKNIYNAEIFNSSLHNEDNYTGQWGAIFYLKGEKPVIDDMIKVNLDNETAKKQADDVLERVGIDDFMYDCCVYNEEVLQITPEGSLSTPLGDTLSVFYYQRVQGVPVRTTLINDRISPGAYVVFDSEGVCKVCISEYEFYIGNKIQKCITYEEAIEIFKEYISKNIVYDGSIYEEVRFQFSITEK